MYSNALLGLELIAVLLAVLYLLLAVRQDIRCWIAGIISSLIYLFLMYQANLYMESVLQIFYVFMGIYGWSQWNLNTGKDKALKVSTWSLRRHVIVIFSILGFSFLAGNLLEAYTNAALPFFDSLTTFWGLGCNLYGCKEEIRKLDILVCYRFYFRISIFWKGTIPNGIIVLFISNHYYFWI